MEQVDPRLIEYENKYGAKIQEFSDNHKVKIEEFRKYVSDFCKENFIAVLNVRINAKNEIDIFELPDMFGILDKLEIPLPEKDLGIVNQISS